MEELKMIIAGNLGQLRRNAGMTQLELAEYLNYSDKAVSKWERGESASSGSPCRNRDQAPVYQKTTIKSCADHIDFLRLGMVDSHLRSCRCTCCQSGRRKVVDGVYVCRACYADRFVGA